MVALSLMVLGPVAAMSMSMMQHSIKQNLSDECWCMNWKDTYANHNVECGATAEYYLATGKTYLEGTELAALTSSLGGEFCDRFYKTLNDNYCVNVNMGTDAGQWCFVDSKCSNLNGGTSVNSGVSWKKCQARQDTMLREYEPEALASLAKSANLDLGLLHKMSYPLYKGGLWKDVSSFWNVPLSALNAVPEEIQSYFKTPEELQNYVSSTGRWGGSTNINAQRFSEMEAIKNTGRPYSFDMDADNHPPHIIVEGEKVYLVMGGLECLSGC